MSSQSSTCTGDTNINSNINIEFEQSAPFQEGIISEIIEDLTNHSSKNPKN